MQFEKLLMGVAQATLFSAMVVAQTQSGGANRMGSMDNGFVSKAAQGGMGEVELGKLAQQNASDEKVKAFGKRMVDDHTKAGEELSKIASKKGITLPSSLDSQTQATKDRLSKLNGAAFDRAYMADMVKDHKKDVSDFRKESNSGSDPDVKAFAAKTLPTLEDHLKAAESTSSQLKH
jgi:putative membrane protein